MHNNRKITEDNLLFTTPSQLRHSGRDCRNPEAMDGNIK
jgi:hypothetical protein